MALSEIEDKESRGTAELEGTSLPELGLVARDVRAKRPPALSFVLRWSTVRTIARILSLAAIDFGGLFLAIFTALCTKSLIRDGHAFASTQLNTAWLDVKLPFLVTALLFVRYDLYAERSRRPGLNRIVAALFQMTIVALIFLLANGYKFSSYYLFYGSFFFAVVYIGTLRYTHTWLTGFVLDRAGYRRRALLVGRGSHIEEVAHALENTAHSPVEVIGFISLTPRPDNGLRSLGEIDDLPGVLDRTRVQEVIIADPDFPQERAVELVDVCHERGVTVHIAPSTMEILIQRAEFVPGQSVPLFTLRPPVFEGVDFVLKRTFDLVVSIALLALLSPLLLLIAISVAISSRGPVLYASIRPGMGGKPFSCWKFRTMRSDADQMQADLESLNEASGALFKIRDDPRLTPVGRLLRRFSLDELPQLWNVVRGEMSLVGPRPLPLRDFERLEPWHRKRYHVLPGITGLWQVSGRSDLDFDDLVRLDFLYLERWSIFLDMVILLKTVPAVLTRRGAF
jgi:exopolysaccharide biosynthesis polyprenyl glycosylphosphotransferase